MKTLMIASVAGLLLGTGVGTAVSWVRRPAAPEAAAAEWPADSAAAALHESGALEGAPPQPRFDSEPVTPVGAGDAGPATAAVSHAPDAQPAAAPAGSAGPPQQAGGSAARPGAVGDTSDVQRMAQIFGTMKPQEAARVLEKLSDREAEALLLGLADRKAAAILASLPADRAAALTRSILARNGQ